MKSPRHTLKEVQALLRDRIPEGMVTAEHTTNEHWYRHHPSGLLLPSVTAITGMMPAPHLKKWAVTMGIDHLEERLMNGLKLEPGMIIPTEIREAMVLAHDDIFEDAGDVGTQGHGIIERYLEDWIAAHSAPEDITSYITGEDRRLWAITRSAQKFCKDYRVIPIAPELLVANEKDGYAGTLDFLAFVAFPTHHSLNSQCQHPEIVSGTKNWHKIQCMSCDARWQYYLTLVDWKTSNDIWKEEYYMQVTAYWKAFKRMTGLTIPKIVIVRLDKNQEKYEPIEVLNRAGAYRGFLGLKKGYDYLHAPEDGKVHGFFQKERVPLM